MTRYGLALAFGILACSLIAHAGGETTQPATRPTRIDLDADAVREYRGDISDKLQIGMSLRISRDGKTATGSYFYCKYCTDIRLEATIKGRSISIREFDVHGNQTGQFTGESSKTDPRDHYQTSEDLQTEVIVGYWSKPDGSKRRPFYLNEKFRAFWREGESRYSNAGFDDVAAVDDFMSRFRQAVLDAKVDIVAGMVDFPIRVSVDGKRRSIEDEQDLRRNYKKVFTADYVERIRMSPPCHMFSRDPGVMLGNGEVWVAPAKRDGKPVPVVIAINNDPPHEKP